MEKSDSIIKLSAALVKYHSTAIRIGKDATNPHFKNRYASLSQIIEGTEQQLAECGLAVIQLPEGENHLRTILLHESGEYIAATYKMNPVRNDPQALGSAITYQRRYALGAILSLNIDDDDDGQEASKAPAKPAPAPQPKTAPVPQSKPARLVSEIMADVAKVTTVQELTKLYKELPAIAQQELKDIFTARRSILENNSEQL